MSETSLIKQLQNPKLFSYPVTDFKVIETHISWVLLTGQYAYKIKKPMDFGFLDFTTLEKRRLFCEKELQLNKRLAPEIYEAVVPITGSIEKPEINGNGPIIEYAIKMHEFSQESMSERLLRRGELTTEIMEQIAEVIANFHKNIEIAAEGSRFGTPEQIYAPVIQNFEQIFPLLTDSDDIKQLQAIEAWSKITYQKLIPTLNERKKTGFIRACHGDMHLGNIIMHNSRPIIFDCIEFNEDFRWTDVMGDTGFLIMDLLDHQCELLANNFLNHYLLISGDYAGLKVLPFYVVYRAIVRAKITLLYRAQLKDAQERATQLKRYQKYIQLVNNYIKSKPLRIILMHGLSGSGKSSMAKYLSEMSGAIHIRSDVERKRLQNLGYLQPSHSKLNQDLYTEEMTDKTYQRLAELTKAIISANYSTVVDATFLSQRHRQYFLELAKELNVECMILHCQAEPAFLEKALINRSKNPSEANLEVLRHQMANSEPLTPQELEKAQIININKAITDKDYIKQIMREIIN